MTSCSSAALVFCFVLLVCSSPATLNAQTASRQNLCFAIHVRLNGKLVAGPQTITVKTTETETSVAAEGDCFKVSPALLNEKAVDVFFTVPGNKLYLSSIQSGFFAGPWDVDLADKHFGKEVALPKHIRAREACAVTFHVGEPETAIVTAPCRTQIR